MVNKKIKDADIIAELNPKNALWRFFGIGIAYLLVFNIFVWGVWLIVKGVRHLIGVC